MSLLAVDVGAGTQDILLFSEDVPLEGSIKLVLPSPTVILAGRIERSRRNGTDIFLKGYTMGGGAISGAVRRHIRAGLNVYATKSAALTLNDSLDHVRSLGVKVVEKAPDDAKVLQTGDMDIDTLKAALSLYDVDLPLDVAVAVQDHGFAPGRSNREFRFSHIEAMIRAGGRLESFVYREPPAFLNRMVAVRDHLVSLGYNPVLMDTGPAALFGAACDPAYVEPALVVNFGNGHTLCAVMDDRRIVGLFEHHTSMLSPVGLAAYAAMLCSGSLTGNEIFKDGGHGAYIEETPGLVRSVLVTGPQRERFMRAGALLNFGTPVFAAPGGDMMITGCIGLLEGWRLLKLNTGMI